MPDLPAGIHTTSPDDYHADRVTNAPTLSASIAHLLVTASPLHAWTAHPRLNPAYQREEDGKFDIGTVAHAVLLEGRDVVEVVDFPDWRTGAAREAREAAREAGRVPLLAKHWAAVEAMVSAARDQLAAHTAAPALFAEGLPEQTLVWEEDGGVGCRARLDWLRDDRRTIDDYKTTSGSANPERWERTLFGIGADVQAAWYLRGLAAVTRSMTWAEFRWVVQETFPPYALSVVSLAPSALELASRKVEWALAVWRECLGSSRWPGYPVGVAYVESPGWEESRWLERELREAA